MTEHKEIYRSEADKYQALVDREDYQSNLMPGLMAIHDFTDCVVLELGAGTGRLTSMFAPLARSILAMDVSTAMLHVTAGRLAATRKKNVHLAVADHRDLPVAAKRFDVVIAGWSFCYLATWNRKTWQAELERGIAEVNRVLRPGGKIILVETLGTGETMPNPPAHLKDYLGFLAKGGFQQKWLRTDYRFKSRAEAQDLTQFFFGEEMVGRIEGGKELILPECTGIWWKTSSGYQQRNRVE
jgi:ubiquinone/menaquinone biosynthesis C-methylase UbiE